MNSVQDIQNIVVGMDDDRLADAAIETALHLQPVLAAQLHIVHALNLSNLHGWFQDETKTASIYADLKSHARRTRLERLKKILDPFDNQSLDNQSLDNQSLDNQSRDNQSRDGDKLLSVHLGKPARVLLEHAADLVKPLLILGRHREHSIFDFGGTTREVLSAAACPVWIQAEPCSPIRRILVAIDLSAGSDAVLALAKRLTNLLSAELIAVHVFEPPQINFHGFDPSAAIAADRQRTQREFDDLLQVTLGSTAFTAQFLEGRPADSILDRQAAADLIVLGSHGHSQFSQVMLGSQAHRIAKRAGRPVVIVPQRAG